MEALNPGPLTARMSTMHPGRARKTSMPWARVFSLLPSVLLFSVLLIMPAAVAAETVSDREGLYTLEVPEGMAIEFRETTGCRMHILQDNEKVFGCLISRCAQDVLYTSLERFAGAKLKGIKKPDWKETLREETTIAGAPAIHARGTYTLAVRDYKTEMLSDMYFIFVGQRGFEVEFFHPVMALYPYQEMKDGVLSGLKVYATGKAAQVDKFDQVLRETFEKSQEPKNQSESDLKRLIDDLASTDPLIRLRAAKSLGKLGPKAAAAIPSLTKVAREDPDEDVRGVAAAALASVGAAEVSSVGQESRDAIPSKKADGGAPRPGGKALAEDVITHLNESYYSLRQTGLANFDANFTVTRGNVSVGKMQIRWEPEMPRLQISFSGELAPKYQTWLRNTVEFAFRSTLLSGFSIRADFPVEATMNGNRYELDYSADPSVALHKAYITEDFRCIRDIQEYADGLKLDTEFAVQHAEGKHFVKAITRQAAKPGAQPLKNTLTFTYTHRGQYIFLKRIVIEDFTPSGITVWRLEPEDVLWSPAKPQ